MEKTRNCPKCGTPRKVGGYCKPCKYAYNAAWKRRLPKGIRIGNSCDKCGSTQRYIKGAECVKCKREYVKITGAKRRANRTPQQTIQIAKYLQDWYYRKKYGIDFEDVQVFLDEQGGGCAVCGSSTPEGSKSGRWQIDHDHRTNEMRGVLCGHCNRGIGSFLDDITRMEKAIAYLKNPPMRKPILTVVK